LKLALVGVLAAKVALAQNYGCSADLSCSKYGYCGNTSDYCGTGCQEGPCYVSANNSVVVGDIVTDDFSIGIINPADDNCAGISLYTRSAFLDAASCYSQFDTIGFVDDSKCEVAASFAHVTHKTRHFCYIEEIDSASKDYCDEPNTQYSCVSGRKYYGNGLLQLFWNYNYGPAGNNIGFDGLNNPDIVVSDCTISLKTALW
ncbi:Glycoside hydrolase, family 19, catalytic, partial [Dillenia turbinata]